MGKQPEGLTTRVHENAIVLTWTMTDRSGISHYEIEYGTREIKTIVKTKDLSTAFTISSLRSKMTYTIRVRAVWENDQTGKWSLSTTALTGTLHQLEEESGTHLLALV